MKKILLFSLIICSLFLLTGCFESPENPTLRGVKTLLENDKEEIIYEWDYYEPTHMIKITKLYTYYSGTNSKYNEMAIECDSFKRQGSLYDCVVERKNGTVVYKEFYYKDEELTQEKAKELILSEGYTLE